MRGTWSTSQNFTVSVGDKMMSFTKISNLKQSVAYQKRTNGGLPFIQTDESEQAQGMEVLTLVRGCNWEEEQEDLWRIGSVVKYLTIFLYNYQNQLVKVFGIEDGVVVKHSYSDLDAGGKDIFTEQIEIAHMGLTVL